MTPAIFQDRAGESARLIFRNQSIAVFGDGGRIGIGTAATAALSIDSFQGGSLEGRSFI